MIYRSESIKVHVGGKCGGWWNTRTDKMSIFLWTNCVRLRGYCDCVCVCHYYKLTKHSAENKVTFSDKHPGPGFVLRTKHPVSKPSLKQHIKLKS